MLIPDPWHVEITCTDQKTLKSPSNMPEIKKAKGGPPKEEWNQEDFEPATDLDDKVVDVKRFNDNWARYLKGEVWTKTRLYDVAIFERDEEDDEGLDDEDDEEDDEGDDEAELESDDEDDGSRANDPHDATKIAFITGEEVSSNKRAAPEDPVVEDSTKRIRHE